MGKILLQATIPDVDDDWHVGRFSMLADELRRAGHEVVTRNLDRGAEADDPVLSTLDTSDVDQLWLLAVDVGDGLSAGDGEAIVRFREAGGGVLTARDHEDLGSCVLCLGSLGRINHFHAQNPEPDAARDDQDNPHIDWPNYHSGANGDYQPVFVEQPVHDVLRSSRSASGSVDWFPAHPHEGAVSAPADLPFARAIAQGRSKVTGRRFNLAVAIDGEVAAEGRPLGRAIALSTFHQLADVNWDVAAGAPSFVTDPPGTEIAEDPERLEQFKDYVRNIADWLQPSAAGTAVG